MSDNRLIDLEVWIVHETEKGLLVNSFDTNIEAWLPKSEVEIMDGKPWDKGPRKAEIALPLRLAQAKGLT